MGRDAGKGSAVKKEKAARYKKGDEVVWRSPMKMMGNTYRVPLRKGIIVRLINHRAGFLGDQVALVCVKGQRTTKVETWRLSKAEDVEEKK